jgi:S-adenosylmethionine:tRNA ribosyltransferase-isomerase
MEAEEYRIPEETLRAVSGARRVIAVGTTVTRALESWARTGAAHGRSGLFIHPPFDFRVVGALWTNFHLPRSTPLALAAAFAGWPCLRRAYEEAVRQGYRFYSYGDAMLIV